MKTLPLTLLSAALLSSSCTTSTPAGQATISDFSWGRVTIQKADGTVERTTQGEDWVLTPKGCQRWNYKQFGKCDGRPTISHLWPRKPANQQGTGVLPYAIDGLLKLAGTLDVIIISTGVHDDLGVNATTKKYLQKLKQQKIIQEYYILNSEKVPAQHNACLRAGQRVGTLLHTTC